MSYCNVKFLLRQDLPTNSASSSPAAAVTVADQLGLFVEKKPFERVNGQSSTVHYQNHTLYQIHHHHYHHMLMADDYHKDPVEHYKPKELKDTHPLEENFDYAAGGQNNNNAASGDPNSLGHKYNQYPLIVSPFLPLNANSAAMHVDEETAEYSKPSREFWMHEGEFNWVSRSLAKHLINSPFYWFNRLWSWGVLQHEIKW